MGKENRKFNRHGLSLEAQVVAKNVKACPAVIRDFCLGGCFVSFSEDNVAGQLLNLNDPITIHLKIPTKSSSLNFHMHARITRIEGNSVGVSFNDPDPAALQALQNLSNSLNKQTRENSIAEEEILSNSSVQRILALCRRCLIDHLSASAQGFFPSVEDELLATADKATNNTLQRDLFDTIPLIKKNRGPIVTGFSKRAMEVFDYFSGNNPDFNKLEEGNLEDEDLSLVNQDEFEEWLVVKVLISKAETTFSEDLFDLEARFSHLLDLEVNDDNNPVAPQVICHAFAETIDAIDVPKISEKIIFSVFEKHVVDKLSVLYNEINDVLINSGVLPKIKRSKVKQKPRNEVKTVSAIRVQPFDDISDDAEADATNSKGVDKGFNKRISNEDAQATIDKSENESVNEEISPSVTSYSKDISDIETRIAKEAYSTIQNILDIKKEGYLKGDSNNTEVNEQLQNFKNTEVVNAIDQISLKELRDSELSVIDYVKELLLNSYGDDASLGEKHVQVLKGVENLYNAMLNTDRLTDHMQSNFEELKLPIAKVVVQDESFFEDVNHPARKVLNRMGQLGVKNGIQNIRTKKSIDEVVDKINDQYVDNLNIFDQALEKLDELYDKQKLIYERNINRVTEACEGQQKIDLAKETVEDEINKRIGGKSVPKALPLLFEAGWIDLLNHAYIRKGPDSNDWKQNLDVIDMLMIKLGANNDYKNIDQSGDVSGRQLFNKINTTLENIISQQGINQKPLNELKNILEVVDNDSAIELEIVNVPGKDNDSSHLIKENNLNGLDKSILKAKNLRIGDWLEQTLNSDEKLKIHLVWLGEDFSKFVFVDHKGMKVTEFSLQQIAIAFSEGKLVYLPEGEMSLVDHGLDKMIENVYDELAFQTSHDQLTGLMNRQEFEKQVQKAIDVSPDKEYALCYLGLDQFKVINNTCGFDAGDKLLIEITQLLNSWLSADGFIGRLGGDEFGIFIKGCSENDAYQVVDNQMNAVQEFRYIWEEKTFTIGASSGLVFINDFVEGNAKNLLMCANSACDVAKEAGRNRIEVYSSQDAQFSDKDEVMMWVTRLNSALEEDRIRLRCQKIAPVLSGTNDKPHFEVLLCVEGENGLQLPPADFIFAAEQYNRMQVVDRWVISNVFDWMVKNHALLDNINGLAINLSGHSLNDDTLLSFIWDKFVELDIPRNKLIFEITETATVTNLEKAADFINEMKDVGCKFALDDFGSGLSSYAYLKKLPVDYVKIDGVFVKELATDKSDFAMVKSIHEMAKFLGKRTVAEYVENNDILDKLKEIGIDYAQGWGIEKPIMLEDLNEGYFVPDEQSALF